MPAYWEIAAHSAYNVFLVQLSNCHFSFSHFGFLIAPFPDRCLLVPFYSHGDHLDRVTFICDFSN